MSIFETIHRTVNTPPDTLAELRIIAKDATALPKDDRAVLVRAADELEFVCKALIATQALLIESQQRRIATNEQLLELKRMQLKATPVHPLLPHPISMGSGPMLVRPNVQAKP